MLWTDAFNYSFCYLLSTAIKAFFFASRAVILMVLLNKVSQFWEVRPYNSIYLLLISYLFQTMSTNRASQEYLRIWDNPDRQWSYEVGGYIRHGDLDVPAYWNGHTAFIDYVNDNDYTCVIIMSDEMTFIAYPDNEDILILDNEGMRHWWGGAPFMFL